MRSSAGLPTQRIYSQPSFNFGRRFLKGGNCFSEVACAWGFVNESQVVSHGGSFFEGWMVFVSIAVYWLYVSRGVINAFVAASEADERCSLSRKYHGMLQVREGSARCPWRGFETGIMARLCWIR
jgi:hypothetical protein